MDHEMTNLQRERAREELEKAVSLVGSKSELAEAIEVTRKTLYNWFDSGVVPALKARQIHELTNGQANCQRLRPDLFGAGSKDD